MLSIEDPIYMDTELLNLYNVLEYMERVLSSNVGWQVGIIYICVLTFI